MTPLAQALKLAKQGYTCFPCRADKRPFPGSHGFLDGSTDEADLRSLWSRYLGELVGVATGPPSQIAVLDIDAKHREAQDWWQAHRLRLPPTRTHRTRSGGLHLIYGDYDGLRCSAGLIALGVDVRADGGYIIWWPAADLRVLADIPVAPWPDDLVEALAKPATVAPPTPLPALQSLPPHCHGDLRPTLHRAIGIARIVADAVEGERNRALYWGACRAREMIEAGELDEAVGSQVIEGLHCAAVRAGLPVREVERTILSALRA